jgi:triosephosphate isomerase
VKKIFLFGNWKMNNGLEETKIFFKDLTAQICEDAVICDQLERSFLEVCIFPPFTSLYVGAEILAQNVKKGIFLGGQNGFYEDKGAFTGEISLPMLKETGCSHVLIGHSERRHIMGETDDLIHKKLQAALHHGLTPVLCFGETLSERESDLTFEVIERQILKAVNGLTKEEIKKTIWAYEPVWAIGTGRTASPENAEEACSYARTLLCNYGNIDIEGEGHRDVHILYGGSVKAANVVSLLEEPDIDGALIGGASITADSMLEIIHESLHRG